jgi:predicted metal-dependent hydrolase
LPDVDKWGNRYLCFCIQPVSMATKHPALLKIDDIGPVLFKPDQRCRRLSIRVKPFEGVQVSFPPGFSIERARAFVEEKKPWLRKAMQKVEEREGRLTVFDESTQFKTRSFTLLIQKAQRDDVRLFLNGGCLKVYYPSHLPVTHPPIQEAIRFGIEEAMRREAKRILPEKMKRFAKENGFRYKQLFIKNLKSRWGSCSFENNINLNLQLMRLPDHLIDYVVLHELCHTVEKNHGSGFWSLLDRFTEGRARLLSREMKQYRTTIY